MLHLQQVYRSVGRLLTARGAVAEEFTFMRISLVCSEFVARGKYGGSREAGV
jgi:hypothetical protein